MGLKPVSAATAAVVGVTTGLTLKPGCERIGCIGSLTWQVPAAGLALGIALQAMEERVAELRRIEELSAGLTDGSTALLARAAIIALQEGGILPDARGYAGGWTEPSDADAMIG